METYTELRKLDCEACGGRGFTLEDHLVSCKFCFGQGWHEQQKGKEELCPECDGYGSIVETEENQCEVCSGKGYFVHIFEVVPKKVTCSKCDGCGYIIEQEKCESCFGFGFAVDDKVTAKGCPDCNSYGNIRGCFCPRCEGVGLVDFETGKALSREHSCGLCEGLGYLEKSLECPDCSGSGETIEIESAVDITPNNIKN